MAQGSEVIFTHIRNIPELTSIGVQRSNVAIAVLAAAQAKALAPVDKGQLVNSIQYLTGDGHKGGFNESGGRPTKVRAERELKVPLKLLEAAIGATALHAVYLELGTSRQAPQSFLRPAIAIAMGKSPQLIKEKLNEEFALGPLKYGQVRERYI